MYAASAEEISLLDEPIGDFYRRLYFIRRAIMTILEIKGALHQIDQWPEFREKVATSFTPEQTAAWRLTVDFLNANDAAFKAVRNDVGGHFSEKAADHALREMGNSEVGAVTIREGAEHNTAGVMLEFVDTIVAVAMTRNRGEEDARKYYEETLRLLKRALGHITLQVQVLSYHYLWERFGA